MAIIKNSIRCLHCNDTIESKTVHDFKYCKCQKVAVDGGKDYLKRSFPFGKPEEHYEELSVTNKK